MTTVDSVSVKEELKLVSDIIDAAINLGGDIGGAYPSDWKGLETAIGAWLVRKGLNEAFVPSDSLVVDGYFEPIQRISIESDTSDNNRYYIVINDSDIEKMENKGAVIPPPGVPLQLGILVKGEKPTPFFSDGNVFSKRYSFYEVDCCQAERDSACVFYQSCARAALFAGSIPMRYLKRIRTAVDDIEDILKAEGYHVGDTTQQDHLLIRKTGNSKAYVLLRKDGSYTIYGLDCVSQSMINLLQQVHGIYWEKWKF